MVEKSYQQHKKTITEAYYHYHGNKRLAAEEGTYTASEMYLHRQRRDEAFERVQAARTHAQADGIMPEMIESWENGARTRAGHAVNSTIYARESSNNSKVEEGRQRAAVRAMRKENASPRSR